MSEPPTPEIPACSGGIPYSSLNIGKNNDIPTLCPSAVSVWLVNPFGNLCAPHHPKKLPLTELIIRLIPTPAPDSESLPDHVTCPPRFQQHCSCCRRGCIVYCDNSCQRSKQMSTAHWWMFLSAAGGKGWAEPRPKAVEATARWWWFMAIVCGKCDGQMPAAVVVFSFILWFCCGLSAACQMGKKGRGGAEWKMQSMELLTDNF